MMEFTAKLNYTRVSPQKAKLVLDLIKGRRVGEALTTLTVTNKGVAPAVTKLLRSAVENANYASQEKGFDLDLDDLYVKSAIANEGPRMKRIRPAPMGRAFRYQRRIAHLEIVLAEKKRAENGKEETVAEAGAETRTTKGKTAGKAGAKSTKNKKKTTASSAAKK